MMKTALRGLVASGLGVLGLAMGEQLDNAVMVINESAERSFLGFKRL